MSWSTCHFTISTLRRLGNLITPFCLSFEKNSRHGFYGKTEIIADVGARHGQFELLQAALALGQIGKEGCDALNRVLPPKDQQVLLRSHQPPQRHRQQFAGKVVAGIGAQRTDTRGADRLGKEVMYVVGFEAEHFTRQMEGGNLAPPVGKQAIYPHGAELDPVKTAAFLALCVNLGASRKEAQRLCIWNWAG